jgi:hypothetical protein
MTTRHKGLRIPVEVKQRHIDESLERNSSHCMAADAIKDAIPDAKFVSVDLQTIRWTDPEKHLRYMVLTPRIVQERLIAFDQGLRDALEPFTFTMREAQVTGSGRRYQGHAPDTIPPAPDGDKVVIQEPVETAQEAAEVVIDKTDPPAVNEAEVVIHDPVEITPNEAEVVIDDAVEAASEAAKVVIDKPPAARKPRKKYTRRTRLSTPDAPGMVPTTLGGRLPPLSVLARREFGLRVLRR